MYENHFAHSTDLTYNLNCLSIPVIGRLNLGIKTKLFVEVGAFLDLDLGAKREGTMHTYILDQNNHFEYKEFDFNDNVRMSNLNS